MTFPRLVCGLCCLVLSALPARAEALGVVLPETPVVAEPNTQVLNLVLSLVNPFTAVGAPLERPQVFTALRHGADGVERTEHLSVLDEVDAFGAPAWETDVALPHAGVYHFIMKTKAVWVPELDRFVQYVTKVQVPVGDNPQGWDSPTDLQLEIVPQTRPFGLCTGMLFTGQVLLDGKPLPDAAMRAAHLNPERKGKGRPIPPTPWHEAQVFKADGQGRFAFACPLPGWWAFVASNPGDPLQGPGGQLKPLEYQAVFLVYMDPCKERLGKP